MKAYYEWELTHPKHGKARVIASDMLTAFEKAGICWGVSWVDVARDVVFECSASIKKLEEVGCSDTKDR